ncbi:YecA family protein [Paenibacillus kobensis]|uniref:YecA family protein n=1 Tax=Paenibacillus kobensis TaxID=59841 RepID=UPI0013E28C06|nr:SEC-C domain-containing protein [Paenibacillus kobensis]
MSKIGRNEICPCGSGLKYKRCCMEKEQAETRQQSAANNAGKTTLSTEEMAKWISKLQWKREADREAASMLVKQMEGEYDPSIIVRAVWVWHCYADETTLSASVKLESFCAAVEFLMSEAHDLQNTQKSIAAKYGISPTTLSKRNKELTAFFEERAANAEETDKRLPVMA